jgi:hypothetical protein
MARTQAPESFRERGGEVSSKERGGVVKKKLVVTCYGLDRQMVIHLSRRLNGKGVGGENV